MGIFFLRSFVIWSTLRSPAAQKPEYKHQQIRHLLHWFTCTPLAHLDFFFFSFFFEKGLCTSDMTWCHYLLCQHHPKALISQFMMYCRDKKKTADSNALYKNKTSYRIQPRRTTSTHYFDHWQSLRHVHSWWKIQTNVLS